MRFVPVELQNPSRKVAGDLKRLDNRSQQVFSTAITDELDLINISIMHEL